MSSNTPAKNKDINPSVSRPSTSAQNKNINPSASRLKNPVQNKDVTPPESRPAQRPRSGNVTPALRQDTNTPAQSRNATPALRLVQSRSVAPRNQINTPPKKERKTTTEKILGKSCNNFLHEYLLQRKNDASFVENSQTEHSWYLAELKEQRRLNVQSAEIAFNVFETEKKTQVVRNFWKEIEEKAAIQTASLGHLNIFGRALTQYAYEQEVLTESVKLRPSQKRENETEENVSSRKKVKESMNIPDIHEQKGQCTEPIADAKNNPFFDNNIDDESYGDDNSNCEISEVDLNTEKV